MINYKKLISVGGVLMASVFSFADGNQDVNFKDGFYVGVSGGLAHHYGHRNEKDTTVNFSIADKDFSKNCAIFGIHAGFLKHIKNNPKWMWGLEVYGARSAFENKVDASRVRMFLNAKYSATLKSNYSFGSAIKFGRIVCDRYFIYALIGPEITSTKYDLLLESGGRTVYYDKKTSMLFSIKYGIGISYSLTERIRVSTEATLAKSLCGKRLGLRNDPSLTVPIAAMRTNKASLVLKIEYSF